ncbi:acetyl-CoA hydrolase/transferase C-terminal domain-containing protein [Natronobacterium texcoconense]|uniref:Succinyl-CoA:acetate CoA-transferase n=1 Tax=Natronobacterium texcoconense TaxID=1095778 RepID=A0A1H1HRI4_NATTX|nr:acetyl-CoA hydrolase/transferase C-terminal domain-containing protein [Natronobacterium texcoconense]SDR28034.1 succinyl-CoA:acetate CoA-transferase [Natronobacterium texcoconense]
MALNTRTNDRFTGTLPRTDAETASEAIPDDATLCVSGFGSVGYPKAVPLALAASGRDLELTIVSAGSAGDEIDTELVEADAIERRYSFVSRNAIRTAINEGDVAFSDRNVSSVGDEVQYGRLADPDVAVVEAVAVGEDWFVPSTSIGQTAAFVEAADRLIVEVNHAQPLELRDLHDVYRLGKPPEREPIPLTDPDERIGSPRIEFDPDKLEAVVESDRRDTPYSFRDPTAADRTIASNFVDFLREEVERSPVFDERITLQFGVGSLGNALMGELTELSSSDRDLVYYGEVVQDGLLDMLDDDLLSSASATSLALSEEGQQQLFDGIERYAEDMVLRPGDVSNSPALVDRFGVIAVNSAVEIDLYGNVNSTHVKGSRLINGIGGSGDFNRNAVLSICALPSTLSDGDISRIVPKTFHVDHTEHDVDIFVTEHGVADIRGCSPLERAELIIEQCADPSYRDDLREYLEAAAESSGHVPIDPKRAADW